LSGKHKNTAILTTIVFAGGLVIGRLVSFAVDGLPSALLIFYAAVECAVIPVAWWVYERPRETLQYHSPAEKFAQCVAAIG
jgi:hypothetical protein